MTALAPRCARPMRRYKSAGWDAGQSECGRPAGHNGACRTREACVKYLAADARRIKAKRDRRGRRLYPLVEVTPHAEGLSTCGTYLAFLLHQARGETCARCLKTAAVRWAEQAVRDHYRTAA
jgi:hypothetical protein